MNKMTTEISQNQVWNLINIKLEEENPPPPPPPSEEPREAPPKIEPLHEGFPDKDTIPPLPPQKDE